MRRELIVAASILAIAAAACADRSGDMQYAEADAVIAPPVDSAPSPEEAPWDDTTADAAPDDLAPTSAGTPERVSIDDKAAAIAPDLSPQEGAWIDVSGVTTRSDAEIVADSAFEKADLDADGSIDRTEFLAIAAPPMAASVAPATDGADQTTASPAPQVDDAGQGLTGIFAEAASGRDAATIVSLREALLKRFDQADADNDETLDQAEQETFKRLAEGG